MLEYFGIGQASRIHLHFVYRSERSDGEVATSSSDIERIIEKDVGVHVSQYVSSDVGHHVVAALFLSVYE